MASWEQAGAQFLRDAGMAMTTLSDKISEELPISSTCARYIGWPGWIFSIDMSEMSGFQVFAIGVLGSFGMVFFFTLLSRLFHSVPELQTIPPPTARYDPDVDTQADQFLNADVEPQLIPRGTPGAIQALNPGNGQTIGFIQGTKEDDVDGIVQRAHKAQEGWCNSSFYRRRLVLQCMRNYIIQEQKVLCQISCRDTGKTMVEATLGEILPTLEKLRWLISKEGEAALQSERRTVGPMAIHKVARMEYVPLGVIVAVAPWNYPLHNIVNPVSAALFAGNAVIVKPSEHTAYSGAHFIRVLRRVLNVCGENADLIQCVNGGPAVSEKLVSHPGVDKVFFTGSTAVGKKVAVATARQLTPTVLELGGKDALVVCEDAKIDHAVTICMRAVFQNAGQNCIGIERVYVHRSIKPEFIKRVVAKANAIRLGKDMGAMTLGQDAIDGIQALVDDAVANGAVILTGGKKGHAHVDGNTTTNNGGDTDGTSQKTGTKGWYYQPTVLDDVQDDMRIAREEVFGPVMSILTWDNEGSLINSVNKCPFGLGCNVFTEDAAKGERIMSQLRTGMGNINDFASTYLCQSMPFGGTKQSGSDRFAGIEGLRGCCLMRSTTRDRVKAIKTSVPKTLQYPVHDNALEFAAEINDLVYGPSWLSKMDNVRNLLGMLVFKRWRPRTVGSGY